MPVTLDKWSNNNPNRPITYNIPGAPGAIYWVNAVEEAAGGTGDVEDMYGWDMNYFDLNFNPFSSGVVEGNTGDALPIKLILVE